MMMMMMMIIIIIIKEFIVSKFYIISVIGLPEKDLGTLPVQRNAPTRLCGYRLSVSSFSCHNPSTENYKSRNRPPNLRILRLILNGSHLNIEGTKTIDFADHMIKKAHKALRANTSHFITLYHA